MLYCYCVIRFFRHPVVASVLVLLVVLGGASVSIWLILAYTDLAKDQPTILGIVAATWALVIGQFSGIFQDRIKFHLFGPRITLEFDANDKGCKAYTKQNYKFTHKVTNQITVTENDTIYIRVKARNRSKTMAKNCRAYLTNVEYRNGPGQYETTVYGDCIPLNWAPASVYGGKTVDLVPGMTPYADLVFVAKSDVIIPAEKEKEEEVMLSRKDLHTAFESPIRYAEIFTKSNRVFIFTIVLTAEGSVPYQLKVFVDWRGDYDALSAGKEGEGKELHSVVDR